MDASRNPNARKATMSGCACWSAGVRRWSRPTMSAATASPSLPSARSPWRVSRPTTNMSVSPIRHCWRASFADLDLLDPVVPSTSELERRACEAEAAALAVKGVDQIGRRLGLDRHRRHGAGDLDRFPRLLFALEPGHLDDRDRRRRHRHGTRLRLHLGAARLRSGFARKRRPQGRRAHGGARQSAQGRDLQGAGGVRSPGFRVAGRPSRRRGERRIDRAQDQFPERSSRPATVRQEHPHHRRSLAGARIALADLRRRRRQGEEARASSTRAC